MMNATKAIKYKWIASKYNILAFIGAMVANMVVIIMLAALTGAKGSNSERVGGNVDMMAAVWIFIVGIVSFRPAFKFLLANGLTRKRFFWTDIPAHIIIAALWTVATLAVVLVFRPITGIFILNEVIYQTKDIFSNAVWLFSGFLMLIVLGWFISLLYYRCNKIMKVVISVVPFLFLSLLLYVDISMNLGIFKAIGLFLAAVMGLSSEVPNPYVASLSMLAFTAVLCIFNYLLLRRAEIKD